MSAETPADAVALSPAAVAAAAAPILTRLRVALVRRLPEAMATLPSRPALEPPTLTMLASFRHWLPGRAVRRADVMEHFVYTDEAVTAQRIAELVTGGWLAEGSNGLRLTDGSAEFIQELYLRLAEVATELWSEQAASIPALADLAERACRAAEETGGGAFRVVTPRYEPAGVSTAMLLAERLSSLRMHRFDAHVRAWRGAGLDVASVQSLPEGPERFELEAETNRLAGAPYAVLTPAERLQFVAGLGALPN